MSISLLSDIAPVLPNLNYTQGVEVYNRVAPLVSNSTLRAGTSKAVYWTVTDSGAAANAVAEGVAVQDSQVTNDNRLNPTLNRAIYQSAWSHSHMQLSAAMAGVAGDRADTVMELAAREYLSHLKILLNKIERDMLFGTGTATAPSGGSCTSIVGILEALKTSGSYAGLDVGTYPGMASNLTTSVGAVTRTIMDQMLEKIDVASATTPKFIMCSPKTAGFIKRIGDAQVRFDSPGVRELNQIPFAPSSLGTVVCSYSGIPVIQNSAWTNANGAASGDGYVLFGSPEDFVLDFLPVEGTQDAVTSLEALGISGNGEVNIQTGLPVMTYSLGKTGNFIRLVAEAQVQFAVLAPNRCGLLTGVTSFTAS